MRAPRCGELLLDVQQKSSSQTITVFGPALHLNRAQTRSPRFDHRLSRSQSISMVLPELRISVIAKVRLRLDRTPGPSGEPRCRRAQTFRLGQTRAHSKCLVETGMVLAGAPVAIRRVVLLPSGIYRIGRLRLVEFEGGAFGFGEHCALRSR
jgi:hypothetical protein